MSLLTKTQREFFSQEPDKGKMVSSSPAAIFKIHSGTLSEPMIFIAGGDIVVQLSVRPSVCYRLMSSEEIVCFLCTFESCEYKTCMRIGLHILDKQAS